MSEIEFPHTVGPWTPTHEPEIEEGVRTMARSLAITYHVDAPYLIEAIRFERIGFADIPRLIVPIIAPEKHSTGTFVPLARQAAFVYLAERGVDDHHIRTVPTVGQHSRRRKFTDQEGRSRFGLPADYGFDLSKSLTAAVQWGQSGGSRYGTLEPL